MSSSSIAGWKPARRYPDTYPGDCPDHAYVLLDGEVHPLGFARAGDLSTAFVFLSGRRLPLDPLLAGRGLPELADRYPSLAYGANRNPGTLAIKMRNYAYEGIDDGLVLPVLKGTTRGRDVVACGLSGQGYLYADLMLSADGRDDTAIESWLPLLDPDQLRVMHDGESVRTGLYTVARFPFRLEGFEREFPALGYAGTDRAFVSPVLGASLTYSTVRVSNRAMPEMTPVEMMQHVLEVGDLELSMARLAGIAGGQPIALELMRFMNERWWIRFRGEAQPDDRYDEILVQLQAVIDANRSARSTAERINERGRALSIEEAYDPGPRHALGVLLAR